MPPTLRQLEYFVAVATHRSFSMAADECNVSQPGLSAQIRALESTLGAPLFERLPRQIALTPAGGRLLGRAEQLLLDASDLVDAAAEPDSGISGEMHVGIIPTMAPYLLPTVSKEIRTAHPDAQLRLHEVPTADLVDSITRGRIDLGVLALPADTGRLATKDIAIDPFMVAGARGNPLMRRDDLDLAVFADMPFVLLEEGH